VAAEIGKMSDNNDFYDYDDDVVDLQCYETMGDSPPVDGSVESRLL